MDFLLLRFQDSRHIKRASKLQVYKKTSHTAGQRFRNCYSSSEYLPWVIITRDACMEGVSAHYQVQRHSRHHLVTNVYGPNLLSGLKCRLILFQKTFSQVLALWMLYQAALWDIRFFKTEFFFAEPAKNWISKSKNRVRLSLPRPVGPSLVLYKATFSIKIE